MINTHKLTDYQRKLIKKAKQESKAYVDLSPHLLNSYVKHHDSMVSSIKLQIGQKLFC